MHVTVISTHRTVLSTLSMAFSTLLTVISISRMMHPWKANLSLTNLVWYPWIMTSTDNKWDFTVWATNGWSNVKNVNASALTNNIPNPLVLTYSSMKYAHSAVCLTITARIFMWDLIFSTGWTLCMKAIHVTHSANEILDFVVPVHLGNSSLGS